MKAVVWALTLCLLAHVSASDVLVLGDDSLAGAIAEHQFLLVEFYAPWCGHCKSLEPEYEAAATALVGKATLAKVDGTIHEQATARYEVTGFPSLKLFRHHDKTPITFDGERTSEGITQWIQKKMTTVIVTLENAEAWDAYTTLFFAKNQLSSHALVLGVFSDLKSEKALVFQSVGAKMEDTGPSFTQMTDTSKYADGTVLVHSAFNGVQEQTIFDGVWEQDTLGRFIGGYRFPPILEFGAADAAAFAAPITEVLMLGLGADEKGNEALLEMYKAVAAERRTQFRFLHIAPSSAEYEDLVDFLKWEHNNEPQVILLDMREESDGEPLKYKFPSAEVTQDSLESFLDSYRTGALRPFFNSDPQPEDWDADVVKVLVGTTHDAFVLNSDKAVFVEYYAPWCGHCKALAPIWTKTAEDLSHIDSLVFAKIDSTANEIENPPVAAFPTLILYPAGATSFEQGITFSGEKEEPDLIDFLIHYVPELSTDEKLVQMQKLLTLANEFQASSVGFVTNPTATNLAELTRAGEALVAINDSLMALAAAHGHDEL